MRYTDFNDIPVSEEWCFKNARSVEQWTHGYHRYPAKFLPNIVKKLIEMYAIDNGAISDVFAGCGTTLVEAKAHGIYSIGVDINPVAQLITRVKTRPIEPQNLQNEYEILVSSFKLYEAEKIVVNKHERIDYWFKEEGKLKVSYLYTQILQIRNEEIKEFLLVCLSHILKNCSRWLQSSTKPQINPNKKPADPFKEFQIHCKKMMRKNSEFYAELVEKGRIETFCDIRLEDARCTSIESESIGTIITSPPYVTSYEYADIHQLTAYWFEYMKDIRAFRKDFIGTYYSGNQDIKTSSRLGQKIVNELHDKDSRMACEVANYFNDMEAVAKEMFRIVQKGGHACIVIGNTTLKDVKIKSAETFFELLKSAGFKKEQVIKRSIPNKLIPTIRNKNTGKFSKLGSQDSQLVYPEEYILIVKK